MTTITDMHDSRQADALTAALERLATVFDFTVVDRCEDGRCSMCGAERVRLVA
jgi:hypothetical protein